MRLHVQIRDAVALLGEGREVLVAQAHVQTEIGQHAPVVLPVDGVNGAAEVGVLPAELDVARLREAQQEIGEIVTGARERLVLFVEGAGHEPAEAVGAARGLELAPVDLRPPELTAHGDVVPLLHEQHGILQGGGLVAPQHAGGVAQTAEVGEGEVRRPPVDGVVGRAVNAELVSHVPFVGEMRHRLGTVAAEIPAEGVNAPGPEVVHPPGARTQPAAIAPVDESQGLRVARTARLHVDVEVQPVAPPETLVEAGSVTVRVLRNRRAVLEVLHPPRQVRGRDEFQQPHGRRVEPGTRNAVIGERELRIGVEDLHRPARHGLREIPLALGLRGQRDYALVGLAAARAGVVEVEERPLTLQDVRDAQLPAGRKAHAVLGILGLGERLAAERKGARVEARIAHVEIGGAPNGTRVGTLVAKTGRAVAPAALLAPGHFLGTAGAPARALGGPSRTRRPPPARSLEAFHVRRPAPKPRTRQSPSIPVSAFRFLVGCSCFGSSGGASCRPRLRLPETRKASLALAAGASGCGAASAASISAAVAAICASTCACCVRSSV